MNNIISIGTANPGDPVMQEDILNFMIRAHQLDDAGRNRLRALYRASGIRTRHSVLDDYHREPEDYTFFPGNDDMTPFPDVVSRMKLYRSSALDLSVTAIEQALAKSGISAEAITHLVTVSCTGMHAPGLDVELIRHLSLSKSLKRTAINYMGCYAALNGMRVAKDITDADPKAVVMVICVELCSIHFQKEPTEDNLLANALFADGAAAFVMTAGEKADGIFEVVSSRSELLDEGESDMIWAVGNTGFEMRLSSDVPDILKKRIGPLVKEIAASNGIDAFDHFAIHPGGKRILDVVETELSLDRDQLVSSYSVLRDYGNMSSPTILFVLNEILKRSRPGDHILALAFGPGLTVESTVLKHTA